MESIGYFVNTGMSFRWIPYFLILRFLNEVTAQETSLLFDMCFNNGTTFPDDEIRVQMFGYDKSPNDQCSCLVKQYSENPVTFRIIEFTCDMENSECPWKMSFHQDGCLVEDFCCDKPWNAKDVTFTSPADLFVQVSKQTPKDTLQETMTIKFRIIAQVNEPDESRTVMGSRCGQEPNTLAPCTTKTTTKSTTSKPSTRPATFGSTDGSSTEVTPDSSNNGTVNGASVGGEEGEFPIVIVAGACAGGVALILILVAVIMGCRTKNCCSCWEEDWVYSGTPGVAGSAISDNVHNKRRPDSYTDDLQMYQQSLPMPQSNSRRGQHIQEPEYDDEGDTYQNVPDNENNFSY